MSIATTLTKKPTAEINNRVAEVRIHCGLSASELAKTARVSRQTIYAIEAGSYVPNTAVGLRLARALGVRVEDLFCLADQPAGARIEPATLLPGAEGLLVAGQAMQLCKVNERWVASLHESRAMYLSNSDAVLAHSPKGERAQVQLQCSDDELDNRLLLAGCDPAMQMLASYLQPSGVNLILLQRNSSQSLSLLKQDFVHVAGSHLREEMSAEANVSVVHRLFPAGSVALVTFAMWQEGLVTANGNPKRIRSMQDLTHKSVAFVNREEGSGSRLLVDRFLKGANLEAKNVRGYDQISDGHLAAAWDVKMGRADCCISTEACSRFLGLHFIPLETVRYDLVVRKASIHAPTVETFFNTLTQLRFRKKLENLGGYDTSVTGEIRE